ncbi:hypothetical protein D9M71_716590 [compost metagenome]
MPGEHGDDQQQQPPGRSAQQGFQGYQQLQQSVGDAAQLIAISEHQPVYKAIDLVGE